MKRFIIPAALLALSTAGMASEGTDRQDRHLSVLCKWLDIGCQKGNGDGSGGDSSDDGTGNKSSDDGTGGKGQGGTGGKGQGGTGGKEPGN